MEFPTVQMHGPTRESLNQILRDLQELPESDQRTKAIAKVQTQIDALKGNDAA